MILGVRFASTPFSLTIPLTNPPSPPPPQPAHDGLEVPTSTTNLTQPDLERGVDKLGIIGEEGNGIS